MRNHGWKEWAWLLAFMLLMGLTGASIIIAAGYWAAQGVPL